MLCVTCATSGIPMRVRPTRAARPGSPSPPSRAALSAARTSASLPERRSARFLLGLQRLADRGEQVAVADRRQSPRAA